MSADETQAECVMAIRPRNATRVTLTFTSFELSIEDSYLRVFDGLDTAASPLAVLTGHAIPQVLVSNNSMVLVLTRTHPGTFVRGFTATYHSDAGPAVRGASTAAREVCVASKRPLSHQCRLCILATIATVCGPQCVDERLHVALDVPFPVASPCLPMLAQQLALEQASRLFRAFELHQPFGLSSEASLASGPSFADVYVSEAGSEQSTEPVFIGLDSGNRIAQCDPLVFPGLLVLAQSTELRMRTDCAGFAWLELSSGQIRRKQEAGVGTEVFVVHDVPGECSAILRSTPPIVNDVLRLGVGAEPLVIACWLMRFFGPQLSPLTAHISQVQFTEEPPLSLEIHLISDVIVRADSRLSVSGRGTLLVGRHQVQVRRGVLHVTRLALTRTRHLHSS
jgi:hypothetical protein